MASNLTSASKRAKKTLWLIEPCQSLLRSLEFPQSRRTIEFSQRGGVGKGVIADSMALRAGAPGDRCPLC